MIVAQLIQVLSKLPLNMECVLQIDSEGNACNPLVGAEIGYYDSEQYDYWNDEDLEEDEKELFEKVIILYP